MATAIENKSVPPPPIDWPGSLPEWFVNWALLQLGMAGQYTYQNSLLGGRLSKGGMVLDFYFPALELAINVQSTYFHYRTAAQRTNDMIQRAQLEGMGIRVVYIQEEDALRNPVFYTREALRGIEH